jgi:hypothetical protein
MQEATLSKAKKRVKPIDQKHQADNEVRAFALSL